MVVGEEIEKLGNLRRGEAAGITVIVDVARRGTYENQALEHVWRLEGRQHADHGAYRMADENRL
jgi:hypothetical protein